MAGLDRTGKTKTDIRASKFREILSFSPQKELETIEDAQDASVFVPLSSIYLPESQPRHYFDEQKIDQLAESIKEHGILENLLVRSLSGESNKYELVAGERRFRAAKLAGLDSVPIRVLNIDNQRALEIALVENLQREDLNPVEETEGILNLLAVRTGIRVEEVPSLLYKMQHETKGRTAQNVLGSPACLIVKQVFQELGLLSWESFTSSRLPLLKMPINVLEALRAGKIEYTKAQAIARVKDDDDRSLILQESIDYQLSLKKIRERIRECQPTAKEEETLQTRMQEIYKRYRKNNLWKDSKKKKRIERLLNQLESLLPDTEVH